MPDIRKTSSAAPVESLPYDIGRARTRTADVDATAAEDSAGFTDGARELSRAREAVEASPDVRAAKVRALKHQVEQGQYQPDAAAVARKLLETGF